MACALLSPPTFKFATGDFAFLFNFGAFALIRIGTITFAPLVSGGRATTAASPTLATDLVGALADLVGIALELGFDVIPLTGDLEGNADCVGLGEAEVVGDEVTFGVVVFDGVVETTFVGETLGIGVETPVEPLWDGVANEVGVAEAITCGLGNGDVGDEIELVGTGVATVATFALPETVFDPVE